MKRIIQLLTIAALLFLPLLLVVKERNLYLSLDGVPFSAFQIFSGFQWMSPVYGNFLWLLHYLLGLDFTVKMALWLPLIAFILVLLRMAVVDFFFCLFALFSGLVFLGHPKAYILFLSATERAWALPLIYAFILGRYTRQLNLTHIVWLVAVMICPQVALIFLAIRWIDFLFHKIHFEERPLPLPKIIFLCLLLLAAGWVYLWPSTSSVSLIENSNVKHGMPSLTGDFYPKDQIIYLASLFSLLLRPISATWDEAVPGQYYLWNDSTLSLLFISVLGIFIWLRQGSWKSDTHRLIRALILSAVFLCGLALSSGYWLGYPYFYPQILLPLVTAILLSQLLTHLVEGNRYFNALGFLSILALLFLIIKMSIPWMQTADVTVLHRSDRPALYDAIRVLPHDVRITGHPQDLTGIKAWAGSSATTSQGELQPHVTRIWNRQREEIKGALDLLFATDLVEIKSYRSMHPQITHLLVSRKFLRGNLLGGGLLSEPLSAFMVNKMKGKRPGDMIWLKAPEDVIAYQDKDYVLYDLRRIH